MRPKRVVIYEMLDDPARNSGSAIHYFRALFWLFLILAAPLMAMGLLIHFLYPHASL